MHVLKCFHFIEYLFETFDKNNNLIDIDSKLPLLIAMRIIQRDLFTFFSLVKTKGSSAREMSVQSD